MKSNHDDVICDLAEYYHIYDYKKFKPSYIATLVAGLRIGSRCFSQVEQPIDTTLLLATIADRLGFLLSDGKHKPKSIFEEMTQKSRNQESYMVFNSIESFEKARQDFFK